MTKIKNHLENGDIILFEKPEKGACTELKNFLQFLKFIRVKGPIKFSYVESEGQLVSNLSLKDNIFLGCKSGFKRLDQKSIEEILESQFHDLRGSPN